MSSPSPNCLRAHSRARSCAEGGDGGGMEDALQTRLDLKGLLPGAVSALQTAGLPSPSAIGKSRGKVPGFSPAPERFGSRAEPLATTRAKTFRPHLCSQGAGPPPGVLRGRMEPRAKARCGSLKSPGRPPRRNASGGAVHPYPTSAGSAGCARAIGDWWGGRGEHAAAPRGLSRRPAAGARLTLRRPRVSRARPAGPGVPRGGHLHRAGRAGRAAGRPPIAGAQRSPWEARGGRGEGGGRGGGRAASPGRSRRAARRGGRGVSERAPPSPDVSSGCPRSRASGGAGGGGGGGHRAPGTAAGERAGMGGAPSGPGGRAGIPMASLR